MLNNRLHYCFRFVKFQVVLQIIVKTVDEAVSEIPLQRVRRPRHFPRPGSAVLTALLLVLAFFAMLGFGVCGVQMWLTHEKVWGIDALVCMGIFVFSRLIAAWQTHRLVCPLCHGTVLHEKRCRKHKDARQLPLIGYRATAVLSLLCTGLFTCMYCGTVFRLKK